MPVARFVLPSNGRLWFLCSPDDLQSLLQNLSTISARAQFLWVHDSTCTAEPCSLSPARRTGRQSLLSKDLNCYDEPLPPRFAFGCPHTTDGTEIEYTPRREGRRG